MRNISFALTTQQQRDKTKTVTRRINAWKNLKPNTFLQGVVKGMGLRKGEAAEKLNVIRVTSVRFEPLQDMLDDEDYGKEECLKEGFPEMTPLQFVEMLQQHNPKLSRDEPITRIEFEYPSAAEIHQHLNPQLEADFQKQVIELAQLTGWHVAHFRPARVKRRGKDVYRTPMEGNPGFPDLVLAKGGRVIFAELKRDSESPSLEQRAWLHAIGKQATVWRPKDWKHIEYVLRQ